MTGELSLRQPGRQTCRKETGRVQVQFASVGKLPLKAPFPAATRVSPGRCRFGTPGSAPSIFEHGLGLSLSSVAGRTTFPLFATTCPHSHLQRVVINVLPLYLNFSHKTYIADIFLAQL
jgi:hypothetical protein